MLLEKDIKIIGKVLFKKQIEPNDLILYNTNKLDNKEAFISENIDRRNFTNYYKNQFYFINNKDGSMRWIYPSNLKSASFLSFYNNQSLKARIYKFIVKILFFLRLGSFIKSGSFTIFSKVDIFPNELLNSKKDEQYSIFTGTIGPNQKAIIELSNKKGSHSFIKIALGIQSKKLLLNEVENLRRFIFLDLAEVILPKYEWLDSSLEILKLSNVKPEKEAANFKTKSQIIKAILEYSKASLRFISLTDTDFLQISKDRIRKLSRKKSYTLSESSQLIRQLRKQIKSLKATQKYHLSLCHGDLTPWNLYQDHNQLYMYDLEMADNKRPVLFDLFHFVFQENILLKRQSYSQIKSELLSLKKHPLILEFLHDYKINFELQLKLYLIYNISYHLELYNNQEHLHTQVYWLKEIWKVALNDSMIMDPTTKDKKAFILDLKTKLSTYKYALLKKRKSINELIQSNSDLDLLIQSKNQKALSSFCKNHPKVWKVHFSKRSFMTTVKIVFFDKEFLQIDFIHKFMRKGLNFMNANETLNNTILDREGFKQANPVHDFLYTFSFYCLNGARMPEGHSAYFYQQNSKNKALILSHFNQIYKAGFSSLRDLINSDLALTLIIKRTNKLDDNKLLSKLRNQINYLVDSYRSIVSNNNNIISFSGVDGAGKTTIISDIHYTLKNKFRKKVVVLRHRPQLLPILSSFIYGREKAEALTVLDLPRQGNNRNMLNSVLRFSYYLLDYLIGRYYIFIKYTSKDYIILYDRYYFDFISDAKRSNIVLNPKFIKFFYRLIAKPKLNFFLYEDANVILERKQELTHSDINNLTENYLSLFDELDQQSKHIKYIPIQNRDRKATVNTVINEYLSII